MNKPVYPVTVFYDGICNLCVGQVERFKRRDTAKRLVFVDISAPDFDADKYDLGGEPLERYMYGKDVDGQTVRGIDTFIWMWRATGARALPFFVNLPFIKQLARLGYSFIAKFRYMIFGKKQSICYHCAKNI